MSRRVMRLRLVGAAPLLMRSGQMADPLNPIVKSLQRLTRKRDKTDADHEAISHLDWVGGLWTDGGYPCVPGEAVEAAFIRAARTKRLGRIAGAGVICPGNPRLEYSGPTDVEALWANPQFQLRVPVQVMGKRTMRTRARFERWAAVVDIEFLPSLLNPEQVVEILRIAGDQVGLGDWRPKFGRFRVESLDPPHQPRQGRAC